MDQTRTTFGSFLSKWRNNEDLPENSTGLFAGLPLATRAIDKKLLDRCFKHLTRAVRNSSDPRLKIKSSPPCLTDILPQLNQIIRRCTSNVHNELLSPESDEAIAYLQNCCLNLTEKLKTFNGLFKEPNSQVFDEKSARRKALTVLTLRFSHILSELNVLYPDGSFTGSNFRITKADAAEFWSSAFCHRILVPWEEFCAEFSKIHPLQTPLEIAAFKTTIDLTRNGSISIFEFDVFVRLFHPWKNILKNWSVLAVSHPAYVAFLTYDEVKERLSKYLDRPGSYVFRQSCTRLGQWAIGYVTNDKRILQTIPQGRSFFIQALVDGNRDGYYLYPDGLNVNIDLSSLLDESALEVINVSHEQYELYCQIGDMFEICKICSEREKDSCIEPCKHLICSECLSGWLGKSGKTCPFCREEIKGHHKVHIDSFKEDTNGKSSDLNGLQENSIAGASDETRANAVTQLQSEFPSDRVKLSMELADNDPVLAYQLLKLRQSYLHGILDA